MFPPVFAPGVAVLCAARASRSSWPWSGAVRTMGRNQNTGRYVCYFQWGTEVIQAFLLQVCRALVRLTFSVSFVCVHFLCTSFSLAAPLLVWVRVLISHSHAFFRGRLQPLGPDLQALLCRAPLAQSD